jgi:hypothetical protein
MKATINRMNSVYGNYNAVTENEILIVFSLSDEECLELGEEIEIDLLNILKKKEVKKCSSGSKIKIKISSSDIHDLRISEAHGTSRFPSKERMNKI